MLKPALLCNITVPSLLTGLLIINFKLSLTSPHMNHALWLKLIANLIRVFSYNHICSFTPWLSPSTTPFVVGACQRAARGKDCWLTPGPFVQRQKVPVCPAVPAHCSWPSGTSRFTSTAIAPTPSPPPPPPPPPLWGTQEGVRAAGRPLWAGRAEEEMACRRRSQSSPHLLPVRSWRWSTRDPGGARQCRLQEGWGQRARAAQTDRDPPPPLSLHPLQCPPQPSQTSSLLRFILSTSSTTTLILTRSPRVRLLRPCRLWWSLCQGTVARTRFPAAHQPCPLTPTENASTVSDSTSSTCECENIWYSSASSGTDYGELTVGFNKPSKTPLSSSLECDWGSYCCFSQVFLDSTHAYFVLDLFNIIVSNFLKR